MSDAKQGAEVAAFRALGWKVPTTAVGAVVTGVVAGSPARSANLNVGDEVISVNGKRVTSSCQMVSAVHALATGTALTLRVKHVKISGTGVLRYGSTGAGARDHRGRPGSTRVVGLPWRVGSGPFVARDIARKRLRLHPAGQGHHQHCRHRRPFGRTGHDPHAHQQTQSTARSPGTTSWPRPARWTSPGRSERSVASRRRRSRCTGRARSTSSSPTAAVTSRPRARPTSRAHDSAREHAQSSVARPSTPRRGGATGHYRALLKTLNWRRNP